MKVLKRLFVPALLCLGVAVQVQAQNCLDMFTKATSLKNSERYAEAITYYEQAMNCDAKLRKDCQKWIKYCRGHIPVLNVSAQEIVLPYQGGDSIVGITSNGDWIVEGSNEWCVADAYNTKKLWLKCRETNNSTRSKSATLTVKRGSLFKTIRVIQEGRPEYIDVSAQSLAFPANGADDRVSIESNAHWDVSSVPAWCKVEKSDSNIHIIVTPNDRAMNRTGDIIIYTPNKNVTIKVMQGAGEERLALSQNNLVMDAEGDIRYLKVYTDADTWFVGDYPTWMNVQRVGKDSICIQCGKNTPNGEQRSGSVQIKTDRQTAGVYITQSPRFVANIFNPDSKVVGGRNLSFGFRASYCQPFVGASAGGSYVGSVVDYGLGTSKESASYKSAVGYSVGAFADVRLYKNFFLTAGVNLSQVKYQNTFNQTTTLEQPFTQFTYMKGSVQNAYKEDYTHTMLEVPILASYRFKLSEVSHLQVSLGPVLNFGLSAKMKFSGNTDGETLRLYYTSNNQPADNNNYVRHTAVSSEFNLYQSCVYWETMYTTGNDAPVPHHETFQDSPLHRFNCGLRVGVAYEWVGLSFGLSYTHMLSNMANKNYWEEERWTVLNHSDVTMKGYSHRINTLEFKLAYTFRYKTLKKK